MHIYANVLLLQVFLKRDAEYCVRELEKLKNAIKREVKPAMHDSRHMAMVIVTEESPQALLNRLAPVLDQDCITNYWALIPSRNIASKNRTLDSLSSHVKMAYAISLKGPKPKHVIQVQTRWRKDRG